MKTHYTNNTFNNGLGDMSEETFFTYANVVGILDAVQIAKYFGVSLRSVQEWVSKYISTNWS